MATCTVCGEWAGIGRSKHDNCTPSDLPKADDRLHRSSTTLYSHAGWLRPVFILAGMTPGIILWNQAPNEFSPLLPVLILAVGLFIGIIVGELSVNLLRTIALTSDFLATKSER